MSLSLALIDISNKVGGVVLHSARRQPLCNYSKSPSTSLAR
ncbi:hypothetical protein ALQ88_200227 [Pseudomonas savastanoi]|nr:hypothetical protein ALQ88_200227 [Pseudomonas savastanoi]